MPGLMLGIDIEWIAPHRPFAAIARGYLGIAVTAMEASTFYRGWTFLGGLITRHFRASPLRH